MSTSLWRPSRERIAAAAVTGFRERLARRAGVALPDFHALYRRSVERPEEFWSSVWQETGIVHEGDGGIVVRDFDRMPGAKWFPQVRLNFAENLLRRRDASDAIVFRGENGARTRHSWTDLYRQVAQLVAALKRMGLAPGDRVAAFVPNTPETVVAMLAATSLGAVWSSCSPDFGTRGVVERFGQIEPKILFGVEGYHYGGKYLDTREKLVEILASLPSVAHLVQIPYPNEKPSDALAIAGKSSHGWHRLLAAESARDIAFSRGAFDRPLYILYSSGTTGLPKCIVHGAGGTLIQHLKEHRLHSDIRPGDRVFYFTTCGWMMWNWLVSALASEATLLLFDGSPFHPDGNVLFDFADEEKMTLFGTSAKYLDALAKAELAPKRTHKLTHLRTLTSTGSPLAPERFDFVYEAIKSDLQLSSISGGTDIVSCFVLGAPDLPVYRGEIQTRGLGMKVEVFDDNGRPVRGEKGELVCTEPFPSMPVEFWNDPDGKRYRAAYFERFPGVWCHGDYIELTEHDGVVVYGRSDAVLNPGGVRIGTAEIYRQVEQMPEVVESVAIGQEWDSDVRVVLFVRLREGSTLDAALIDKIKKQIRANTTPRHVPARIVAVDDIPRTRSGKIVELAIRDVVHNRPVKNLEALANPEALELFRNRAELGN